MIAKRQFHKILRVKLLKKIKSEENEEILRRRTRLTIN
ncbi:hypothetical protein LEP1GSC079_0796 [Leptospira interrogans str. FPW1039]|uniref:Uncharacterized protein n=2 Tax=Leptospira interrogans TaxID=173 RepID=A0A0F6HBW9_LEPIR|nr:hypothetical protein LEP1GSC077_1933 [Leptospira interrogans str. C10069]EKO25795.1 hypothetical protein LEP1GSC104_4808 [Leptospira interrogans str. UI 12621]EMI71344.1 hypothetical protein LEP1GSC200_2538 [Leptospira interrogans serovar Pomona str. CSL10083]EMJ37493.1 hypothetical protein LEP1GSC079_0796 [Leptospira interrogans str. FPW1039]EMN75425.1 hypothetical protein LEP1GSC102_4104 [Leptospira interrogans str. UI 09600]